LYKEDLILGERIGTRNVAENKDVIIEYKQGDLLILLGINSLIFYNY
jgi:thiamine pyrophosphokinase